MASFWQNKTSLSVCDKDASTLDRVVSGDTSCTATKTKVQQADALNSRN
jgi:hypothetical protein